MSKAPNEKETNNYESYNISDELKERLGELCFDFKGTRKELADEIGISKDVLSRIFKFSAIPRVATLIKIADYYSISVEYLLGYSDKSDFEKSYKPKDFQIRFKELKESQNLNNYKIAAKLHIECSYITLWEKKNYLPSLELLHSLADVFDVSLDYLLGRTDDKESYTLKEF